MRSAAEIIDGLGGTNAVAAALEIPPQTISSWKSRSSIPAAYWSPLETAARKRGLVGVTFEALARMAAGKTQEGRGRKRGHKAA